MALSPRDRLRLQIGDTDVSAPLFTDDELDAFLDEQNGSLLLAAAEACDVLATRFAFEFDFDALDQKSFKKSQRARAYADRAVALRERAQSEAGVSVQKVVRRDGYSRRRDYLDHGRLDWPDRCL